MLAKSSSEALRRSKVSEYQREELKQLIKSSDHAKYGHTLSRTHHHISSQSLGHCCYYCGDTSTDGISRDRLRNRDLAVIRTPHFRSKSVLYVFAYYN